MGANFVTTLGDIETLGNQGIGAYQHRVLQRHQHEANVQLGQQLYGDLANFKDKSGKGIPEADLTSLKQAADTGQVQELTSKYNFLLAKQNQEIQNQQRDAVKKATGKLVQENPGAFPGAQADVFKAFSDLNPAAGATFAEHGLSQQKSAQRSNLNDQISEVTTQMKALPTSSAQTKAQAEAIQQLNQPNASISNLSPKSQKTIADVQKQAEANLNAENKTLDNPILNAVKHPIDFVARGLKPADQVTGNDRILALQNASPALQQHYQAEQQKQALVQQKLQLKQAKEKVDLGNYSPALTAPQSATAPAPQPPKTIKVTDPKTGKTAQFPADEAHIAWAQNKNFTIN